MISSTDLGDMGHGMPKRKKAHGMKKGSEQMDAPSLMKAMAAAKKGKAKGKKKVTKKAKKHHKKKA